MADALQTKVEALLREAQAAHHRYENEELRGVRDEQWAAWYADYLLANGLDGLLASQSDADELSAALNDITEEKLQAGNGEDWAAYSAAALLLRMTKP